MMGKDLLSWRKQMGLTQKELALALGVRNLAVSRWERGERRIPALLPLALEALEHRIRKEHKHGFTGGVPGVQETE